MYVRRRLIYVHCPIISLHIGMVSKHKKAAAARARAGRAAGRQNNLTSTPSPEPEPFPEIEFAFEPAEPIEIDSDSESECGYTGGVNYHDSDSDNEPGSGEVWSDDSDGESLAEFEGEELESNLRELRAELDALAAPSKYDLIAGKKSSREWKKAEKKRGFGYTGNSQRTKQRHAKAAREGEVVRQTANDSCADFHFLS
jgi:hypothetical protein